MKIKELAEYHNIPHMSLFDIREDTDIFDLYEKADYLLLTKGHKAQQKKREKELAVIKSSKFYKMKVKYDAKKSKFH